MDDLRERIENMIAERLADHDRLTCQDLHELACAFAELEKNELLRRIANHKNECSCGGKK